MRLRLLFLFLALSLLGRAQTPNSILQRTLLVCNQVRREHGLLPWQMSHRLCLAAAQHSQEMDQLGYFDHNSPVPEFASLGARLLRQGCYQQTYGENLFRCYNLELSRVPEDAVRCWLNSPGHRENLLSARFNRVGMGLSRCAGGYTLTQDLAYEAIEIISQRIDETKDGLQLHLRCHVCDGPTRGSLFVNDTWRIAWGADAQGDFELHPQVSAGALVSIAQAIGPKEWSLETEIYARVPTRVASVIEPKEKKLTHPNWRH